MGQGEDGVELNEGGCSNGLEEDGRAEWRERGGCRGEGRSGEMVERRHPFYVMLVVVFFGASSLSAIFINKAMLTGFEFHYPVTIFLSQIVVSVMLLVMLSVCGVVRIEALPIDNLRRLVLPTILNKANVILGLYALSSVNIPMFSALRRLTVLFTMGAEIVILKCWPSKPIAFAVVMISVGAFVSAIGDVTLSRLGYCLVFVNNVLTALYLTTIKKTMEEMKIEPLTMSFHFYVMGLPLVALIGIGSGDLQGSYAEYLRREELQGTGFLVVTLLSATSAFCILYSTSLCTLVVGPLTTTVTAQVKNVAQTFLGMLSWGYVPTPINVIGLMTASAAQIFFGYLKFQEQRAAYQLVPSTSDSNSNSRRLGTAATEK